MTDTDADAYESPTLPRYRSWAEREAAQRATRDAERDALSQRIQASRASQNRHEREGSQRRQLADIQVFRALMLDVLEHPLAKTKSPRAGSFASFKSVCSLIKQRSGEDPSFLTPGLSRSLPFFYKMVSTPAAWIAIADRLADHPSVRKAWDDVRHLRPDRRKQEAEFAAQFSGRCGDPDVRRYAEELAYAALLGDRHLDTEERRLLLSLRDPIRTIDLYLRAFPWVRIYVSQRKFGWKKKRHESRAYRKLARVGYGLAYLAWVIFAFLPILLQSIIHDPQHKLSNHELCFSSVYFVSIGLPLAVYCLRRVFLLGDAERLISTHNSISRLCALKQ